jgi:hypothetical protein
LRRAVAIGHRDGIPVTVHSISVRRSRAQFGSFKNS